MKTITIKSLTPERNEDYLDFFDNRAFTDGNPNGPCYCTSPNQDEETIKQMSCYNKLINVNKSQESCRLIFVIKKIKSFNSILEETVVKKLGK